MRKIAVVALTLAAGASQAKPLAMGVVHNGFGSIDLIGLLLRLFGL